MPNRYLPSSLVGMVHELREQLDEHRSDADSDDYTPEWEVLVDEMLKPEYRDEFYKRRDG